MSAAKDRALYGALMVAEAAWLYVALALAGLMLQVGGSPLSWAAVTAIMAGAMLVGWLALGLKGETATLALLQGGAGLVVVYAAVAARSGDGIPGLQWTWVFDLVEGEMEGRAVVTAVASALGAIFLWRRGIGLVTDDPASDKLRRTFRAGVMVIAVALIVQIAAHRDIGAQNVLFPFFAAALAGMAFSQVADSAGRAAVAAWTKTIAAAVGIILLAGVLLGLAGSAYGGGPLRLLGTAAGAVRDGLLWLISLPLRWIVTGIFALMRWLRSLLGNAEPVSLEQPAAPFGNDPNAAVEGGRAAGAGIVEAILNVIQYPIMLLIVLAILYVLILAFRRWRRAEEDDEEVDRESIRGDADPGRDMAALLARLIPWRARGHRTPREVWHYPLGQPGISEVFKLYFDYLSAAVERGMRLDRHLTPIELNGDLSEALPGAPVDLMTARFNAACYGHEPTSQETLTDLAAGLRTATATARNPA
ncbi:MAG: hypothetical protein HYY34_00055 [Chloroflexi bacterium]|nr:hypothetical protein [Chloroflexota bacterium]